MTLPTTSPLSGNDDDSDMFGPPRSSPVGYHHHQRSRVPMISPKLRQREERKRILQLCAHKLERIKDSEANLRRSVCINNTYSRLTDEVRREKQSRYLANLPKSETKPETAHDNMYSPYQHNYNNQMELRHDNYHRSNHQNSYHHHNHHSQNNNNTCNKSTSNPPTSIHNSTISSTLHTTHSTDSHHHQQQHHHHSYSSPASLTASSSSLSYMTSSQTTITSSLSTTTTSISSSLSSSSSSSSVDTDLEILDRELSAINASMPPIDPEITQGAEQLEKAVSSRKRSRTEEENDRLVREALSQFYLPSQRLISAIDDYPPDMKRSKLTHNLSSHHHSLHHHLHHHHHHCGSSLTGSNSITDLDIDLSLDINHQNQKEFEVIMDALRLGTSSPTPSAQDSCGQAAMMSESGVFHNLVVTSLET